MMTSWWRQHDFWIKVDIFRKYLLYLRCMPKMVVIPCFSRILDRGGSFAPPPPTIQRPWKSPTRVGLNFCGFSRIGYFFRFRWIYISRFRGSNFANFTKFSDQHVLHDLRITNFIFVVAFFRFRGLKFRGFSRMQNFSWFRGNKISRIFAVFRKFRELIPAKFYSRQNLNLRKLRHLR